MEIHGDLNGTKCLIVILTNGATVTTSREHDLPLFISSLMGDKARVVDLPANFSSLLTKLVLSSNNNSEPTSTTSISLSSSNAPDEFLFNDVDYTLDIVLPLIVGLVVAMILGWMLVRYKMSAHQRSNYNGSIYCCPEECYMFCARFTKCNLRGFKWPKFKKRGNNSGTSSSSVPSERLSTNIFNYNPPVLIK